MKPLVALTALLLLVSSGGSLCAQQKPPQTVVVAQAFQSLLYLPLYVGIDRGFFAKHGLNVKKVDAGGGANGVASVIAGGAMFSLQDPMTAVLANQRGAKLTNIAVVVNGIPVWLIVRKDSSIKTIADLAGKSIATAIKPSTSSYLLQDFLAKKKIAATTTEVLLGTEVAPLAAGKVDAAAVYEPYLENAIASCCRILTEFSREAEGGYTFSTIDALDETLKKQPETVQAFVDGLGDAIRYIHSDAAGATQVALMEFPTLAPEVVTAGVKRMLRENVYPASPQIEKAAFENALALQISVGNIKPGTVTYDAAVDPQFAKRASKK